MKHYHLFSALLMLGLPMSVGHAVDLAPLMANDNMQLVQPLRNEQLNEFRGGFRFSNDYIVNIGLRISTAIDGSELFNSTIANLVIKNGQLLSIPNRFNDPTANQPTDLVNVVQIGPNNTIEASTGIDASSGIANNPGTRDTLDFSSLTSIIQNSLDNQVIGLNTIIDIDAQVSDALKQMRANKRLEDALISNYY